MKKDTSILINESIAHLMGVSFIIFIEMAVNQTWRSVASDLGLQCLPMSILLDARH